MRRSVLARLALSALAAWTSASIAGSTVIQAQTTHVSQSRATVSKVRFTNTVSTRSASAPELSPRSAGGGMASGSGVSTPSQPDKSHLPPAHYVVNPNQTYSYSVMEQDIRTLAAMYPDVMQVRVVGKSVYGRKIYAVGLGKGPATVLITASHHGREWITSVLAMYMLDRYAYAYRNNQSIRGYSVRQLLNEVTLWFIPMVNPDGVTLSQLGPSAFPERVRSSLLQMNGGSWNFSRWKANAQGIDPNIQYDGGWYRISYGPRKPWYAGYKGTKPYQIPEVQAVLNLINQVNPREEIAFHASGGVIYWGYDISPANVGHFHAQAMRFHALTGYPVTMPPLDQQGGGLTDWWTEKMGRPGFTIEVGPPCGESPVPLRYFGSIWVQNQADGLELAAQGYAEYKAHPTSVVHAP